MPSTVDTNHAPITTPVFVVTWGMDWLKKRIADLGKTGAGFARALGTTKERVYEMYRGDRKFQQDEIAPAARFLDLSTDQLMALIEGVPLEKALASKGTDMRRDGAQLSTLLVWRSMAGGGQRGGAFVLTKEKVGETYRPDFLAFVEKAFSFKVVNHDNHPVFKLRETILVNPDQVVDLEDDCLFTNGENLLLGSNSIVGCLVRTTPNHWVVRQYATPKEQELTKKDFPNAWRIVGKYMASVD